MSGPFVRAVTASIRDGLGDYWTGEYVVEIDPANDVLSEKVRYVFRESFNAKHPEWHEFYKTADMMLSGGVRPCVRFAQEYAT